MRKWSSAGILARLMSRAYERGINKHRQLIFGTSSLSHFVCVTREVPSHENLIRPGPLTEDFLPGTARLEAGSLPLCAKLGNQSFPMFAEILHQLSRHRLLE